MNYREFLVAPVAHLAPEKAVDGLTDEQAHASVPGAPHTIAEIVGHLVFWQEWFAERCEGRATPIAQRAAHGWPAVAPGEWTTLRERFVAGLERLAQISDADAARRISPAIEFPPLAAYTVGDALVHVATHTSHHIGQVVLLRQMQGTWPPPAGSWTW